MKKLLAVLMAMSVILSFTTGFSYTLESRLEIVEYGYMSQDNEKINTLYNETSVKGYVEYTNNTESSSFSMILSYYNAEGRLIDTKIASVTATEFEDTVYTPEIAVSGGSGSYFKLFVVNDCINISPVTPISVIDENVKVSSADIISVDLDESDNVVLTYGTNSVITVAADAEIYCNGGRVGANSSEDLINELENYYGYATFSALKNSMYNTVYIEDYETIVVDEVTSRFKVTSKNDTAAVIFDPEDETCVSNLYDENGELMRWEDLKEWDIVAIKRYINPSTFIETVEGRVLTKTVSGIIEDVNNEGTNNAEFIINGTAYKIDPNCFDSEELVLEDDVILYLDILGNIAYYQINYPPINYAYIVSVGRGGTALDPRTAFKLYTSDGQYCTINAAQKVNVDGVSGIDADDVRFGDITKSVTSSEYESLVRKQGDTWFTFDSETDTLIIDAVEAGDVIIYSVNDSGYIWYIDRPAMEYSFGYVSLKGKFSQKNDVAVNLEYNDTNGTFTSGETGRLYLTDDTVIMVAALDAVNGDPTALTADNFALFDTALLCDEQVLEDAYAFNVDEDKNVGFILVTKDVE